MTASPVHLLVTCHGLWGNPSHIEYISESALKQAAKGDARLVVLAAKGNGVTWTHSYDGIDVQADRVIEEIDEEVKKITAEGGKVTKFSIVGYSLGGLVARYTLGLLESRTPSFFEDVKPVNFATFASPAIGIPHYQTFWSKLFRFLGARLLSRSGEQLYEHDSFLPALFNPDRPSSSSSDAPSVLKKLLPFAKGKEKAEPLLKIMADPRYSFYRALSRFERIEVYANTVNDRTVPFITGAFEAHDPFSLARAKAQKMADDRGDDVNEEPDPADGGLKITLGSGAPIVSALAYVPVPKVTHSQSSRPHSALNKIRRKLPKLPMLLRPSTYPMKKPLALLWIASFPISLPLLFSFLIVRFSLQGRQSRKRIRAAQNQRKDGVEGMLQRVGFRIAEVVEQAGVENPEYAGGLKEPRFRHDQLDSAATSGTATPINGNGCNGENDRLDPSHLDSKNYGTSSISSLSSSTSASSISNPIPSSSPLPGRAPFPPPSDEDLALAQQLLTDPILTPSQRFQLEHLNALPQLRKHFVHLPAVRHTHGAIVRRDPRFAPSKKYGTKIVDKWATEARW